MNVLLFSGGIESTCLAYMLRPDVCLTVNYGQRVFLGEHRAAKNIADHFGLRHVVVEANIANLGSGQLAGTEAIKESAIPELWPYRNQFLITVAAMKFIQFGSVRVVIGSAKNDASHADGTPEFIQLMDAALKLQEGDVQLRAPAIGLESIDLIRLSNIDVDVLDMTFSCFESEYPCGRCRGCWKNEALRVEAFLERPTCHVIK